MARARIATALVSLLACTPPRPAPSPPPPRATSPPSAVAPTSSERAVEAVFSTSRALDTIRRLAGIGPREATSAAFVRAAALVEQRFEAAGYRVRRQGFSVPEGVSWGIAVPAGRAFNVIAEPPRFRPERPHLVVGAHLDTVPQSPGANDNASGVAIVLEIARLAAARPPRLPVVLVAFGAEEPRGPGDGGHHFGSAHYARAMSAPRRRAVAGVLSIDRVGTGARVLACTGGLSPTVLRDELLHAARRLDLAARACDNRTSDHWPFERMGHTVARLDGGRFDGYHSARDLPERVRRAQVRRVGLIAWETISRWDGG